MTNSERYQLLDEIGQGGMGVVYRARDTQLDREVALKLLPATLTKEPDALRRFQKEAQIIAKLEHPHIVPIYDTGIREQQPFIVMRLLRGGSLHGRLQQGHMLLDQLWPILQQLARALDATHAKQIIHRDIKPTNILFDEQGTAYISDFGIAKALDATTQYTGNTILGSLAYMSPEQFTGQNINGATDQYSLAIVVFEALTGQLPFQGTTVQMMHSHLQQSPPPVTSLNTTLAPAIDAVLQSALAKKPTDRYETITGFVAALQRAAKEHPVPSPAAPLPVSKSSTVAAVTTSSAQKIQSFYRQGLEAIKNQQWQAASEAFDRVLAIDPNHVNAKIRRREVQEKSAVKTSVKPAATAQKSTGQHGTHKIVKGAGGVTTTGRFNGRLPTKWLIIGGVGILILALILWNLFKPANDTTPATALDNASGLTAVTSDNIPANTEDSIPANTDNFSFAGIIEGTGGYKLLDNESLEISQGDIVVESTEIPVRVQNPFGAYVQLSPGSLVGVRYNVDDKQFAVHCLQGDCLVRGDMSGEVALSSGQAVIVGNNGRPGNVFAAQSQLFSLASLPITATAIVATATPRATVETAVNDFAAAVYGNNNYTVISDRELQINQGDLVVEGKGTAITIRNEYGATVQLSPDGLAGVRYDRGNQQLVAHCLRGTCLVRGDVSGEAQLAAKQAVTVGSNGTPGNPFPAQYELFAFAPVVPTITPTATATNTPRPTATSTRIPPTGTTAVMPTSTPFTSGPSNTPIAPPPTSVPTAVQSSPTAIPTAEPVWPTIEPTPSPYPLPQPTDPPPQPTDPPPP